MEARSHLEKALETYRAIEATVYAALVQLDLAAVADAQDRHEESARLVREAGRKFAALDLPRQVEYAERRARELGIDLGGDERSSTSDG